jgi:hypothetical protein
MWNWLKNIFKKKEEIKVISPKENKMDLSQYHMRLNLKSICYFEKISGKSFFTLGEEDIILLLYATFITNNPDTNMTFNVFTGLMEINENISRWMVTKYQDILTVVYQFNETKEENKDDKFAMEQSHTMTDFATSLVIDYGMDARYVMYDMSIWEIPEFYEAVNTHIKKKMEMERFWTYIKVLPHIDGKKCKSPDKLVPFDWEREEKKKKNNQDLENNRFAIMNMIGKNIFGEPIEKKE